MKQNLNFSNQLKITDTLKVLSNYRRKNKNKSTFFQIFDKIFQYFSLKDFFLILDYRIARFKKIDQQNRRIKNSEKNG